jgi:hypothetical protein
MNTRIALVAGFVSLLVTTAGCARGPVGPSPRPVVAYEVPSDAPAGAAAGRLDRSARFDQTPTPPRVVDPGRMLQPFASLSAR